MNKRPRLKFNSQYWSDVSFEGRFSLIMNNLAAINLISKMMAINPKKRPSAKEVLESDWMRTQLGSKVGTLVLVDRTIHSET